jgi:hypothetical protein
MSYDANSSINEMEHPLKHKGPFTSKFNGTAAITTD